ncbi:MAG: response regulator transcription factor [Bacteroidota bacterium]|nr:response regulator transcription factor [Bacteroidota bacterium]
MIKCFVIDDEQPAIKVIENYIKRIPILQLVGVETNPIKGLEIVKTTQIDLLFLDIQMDEMSGIDVAASLNETIKVIFCTAYSEFAVMSYELNAIDYLMKPISFARFTKAIQRVSAEESAGKQKDIDDDYIFVRTEHKGKMVKIDFRDIDYIEGRSNYIAFHMGAKYILAHISLREMEERLPTSSFMRSINLT